MQNLVAGGVVLAAALFLFAALSKFVRVSEFRRELADYRVLPVRLVPLAAIFIPATELAVVVALVVPSTARAGAVVGSVLLVAFTAAIALNIRRGRARISCACFGRSSQRLHWGLAVRNGALVAPLAASAAAGPAGLQSPGAAGLASGLLAAVCVLVAVEAMDLHQRIGERVA